MAAHDRETGYHVSTRGAYGIVLGVAALTTFACIPLVRVLAFRIGAVVRPDDRRVHEKPTPTLGGVAMLLGFLFAMGVAWRLELLHDIFAGTTEPIGIIAAAILMLIVGAVDDLREVSAPAKVAGIVLCASVLVYFGVSLLVFRVPGSGILVLSTDWSFLLSVMWVLGMTNAVNLIDGLDGLAAGIVAIASGTFFLYATQLANAGRLQEGNIAPLIAVIVLGMCIGFLPWNVHPARIFMGDGGALLLGLLMAASTMVVGGRTDQQFSGQTYFFFAPIFIPLFILGVPIVDTLFAIVRRASRRTGVASADKEHIHHRLMRLGHGHRRSVFILWAWTLLLSGMVLYPTYTGQGNGLVPIGVVALGLALYTVLHPGVRLVRAERRNGGEGGHDGEDSAGDAGPDGSDRGGGSNGARSKLSPEEALAAFDAERATLSTDQSGEAAETDEVASAALTVAEPVERAEASAPTATP
jgi:UDP-GlcNAc:undecaprenyl-phosphate/decaprenyl-phosphate GlcNAc-1-phosphate transferase